GVFMYASRTGDGDIDLSDSKNRLLCIVFLLLHSNHALWHAGQQTEIQDDRDDYSQRAIRLLYNFKHNLNLEKILYCIERGVIITYIQLYYIHTGATCVWPYYYCSFYIEDHHHEAQEDAAGMG
ncbi:hypothetical protein ACJX0J_022116, partial [Zea mays]